jgi:hypothetical protein
MWIDFVGNFLKPVANHHRHPLAAENPYLIFQEIR